MEKYWKLLDLKEHEYSVHETEEEINHIIEFKTRNMEDDRVIRRIDIKTPFPNYNFQYVVAFDSENIYYFLYFFDSIEEQCDCFEEELHEREQLISDMCEHVTHVKVHRDVDIDEKQRKFEYAFEAMESCLKDEIVDLSNQLDILKEQNANLFNLLDKKTTDLFSANRTIDYLRKHNNELKELISKINDLTYPF